MRLGRASDLAGVLVVGEVDGGAAVRNLNLQVVAVRVAALAERAILIALRQNPEGIAARLDREGARPDAAAVILERAGLTRLVPIGAAKLALKIADRDHSLRSRHRGRARQLG